MSEQHLDSQSPQNAPPDMTAEYYRIMTEEDEVADPNTLIAAQEQVPDPRIQELFAPRLTRDEVKDVERAEKSENHQEFYSRLLNDEVGDEELAARRDALNRDFDNPRYASEPTVTSKLEAFARLQDAKRDDPLIDAIVEKYIPQASGVPDHDAIVAVVRTNPGLRYELGSYLLRDKLPQIMRDHPHALTHRVIRNTLKNTNYPGYAHLRTTSREFAAILALSMLDGTFVDPGKSEPIEVDREQPYNTQGQHRIAAKVLLGPK